MNLITFKLNLLFFLGSFHNPVEINECGALKAAITIFVSTLEGNTYSLI